MLREILSLLKKDNLQAQALQDCHEMLDICQQMISASVQSLRHRDDAEVTIDILGLDQKLNSFERDVRRKVMTHLALGNTADLGPGLVLVSIVIDIERIGDYAKNVYDLARMHPQRLHGGPIEAEVAHVERVALEIFRRSAAAFRKSDEVDARRLMHDYKDEVSRNCRLLEKKLVSGEVALPSSTATALALYMRFLKRISAHSRNLASSVVNPFDRIGYPE